MKKFRFRLERVLQYRQALKLEKQKDLLREQMMLQQQIDQLLHMEQQLSSIGIEDGQIVLAQDVKVLAEYADRLRAQIESQKLAIEQARIRVEKAREAYNQAAMDAEALEKLKAKKSDAYQIEILKDEESFLDELSVMRFGDKRK
jgi:flagellar export protein FliJ